MLKENTVEKVKVPFFKRWYTMLILGIIIGGIAFSDGTTETAVEGSKITDEVSVAAEAPDQAIEAPTKAEADKNVEVEMPVEEDPVVVWENEKVTISFKEVSADGVTFLMENKSDKELTVQANSIAVNGFSSNNIVMSDAVAPQSKGYIQAQTSELADVGSPETASGKLRIIDFSGAWDTIDATFTNIPLKE